MMAKTMFDLAGKVAVVTGASRGLGQWIALALAEAGADICITARDENSLGETKQKIEALGKACNTSAQDVTDAVRGRVPFCPYDFKKIAARRSSSARCL